MEATAHTLDLTVNSVFTLADHFRELKEKKETLEDALKKLNAEIESVEEQLANEMINEENSKFTRRGKTFYLTEKLHVSALADRRDELHRWLKENNYGAMVKEYVFPSTLKGFVKEQLEENDGLPEAIEGCISYFKRPAIGMRKS